MIATHIAIKNQNNLPYTYYIQATAITNDTIDIKLTLKTHFNKKKHFYIRPCDSINEMFHQRITVKKHQKEGIAAIDTTDIESKFIRLALYKDKKDMHIISNILQITIPDQMHSDNYKPNPISPSTVNAITTEDEKDENVYVYFDLPANVYGEEIKFVIDYVVQNKEEELLSLPIILPKSSIPISFRITTVSVIDDPDDPSFSEPSGIIIIDEQKTSEQRCSIECLTPKYSKTYILADEIKNKSFEEFKKMIIKTYNVSNNEQFSSKLIVKARVNDKYKNIANVDSYNNIISNASSTTIEFFAYFLPEKPYCQFEITDILIVVDHWAPDCNVNYNKYSLEMHPLRSLIKETIHEPIPNELLCQDSKSAKKAAEALGCVYIEEEPISLTRIVTTYKNLNLNLNKLISSTVTGLTEKESEQIFAQYRTFEKNELIENMK
eukprot:253011_1